MSYDLEQRAIEKIVADRYQRFQNAYRRSGARPRNAY